MSWTTQLKPGSKVVEVTTNGWGSGERTYRILDVVSISTTGRINLSNGIMLDKLGREWGKHSRILDIKYCDLTEEILDEIKVEEYIKQLDKMMGNLNEINLYKQSAEMIKILHREVTNIHQLTFGTKVSV